MNYKIVLATLAVATLTLTGQARAEEEQPDTTFKVYWKDGLRLDTSDNNVRLKIGGRIYNDWTWWDKSDEVQSVTGSTRNGSEFRTARLYMAGELYERVIFKAQYDFANDDGANFKDVYVGFTDVPRKGTKVLIGHLKEPFSLEELTSSKYITFMERSVSTPSEGRHYGVMAFDRSEDENLTWAIGIFSAGRCLR